MSKKARSNRVASTEQYNLPVGSGVNLHLTQQERKKGFEGYKSWHWGYEPSRIIDAQLDPSDWVSNPMPRVLVECGRLVRLHVRAPRTVASSKVHPRRRYDGMIEFSKTTSQYSHIGYDPSHPNERLYLVLPETSQRILQSKLFKANTMQEMPLFQLATIAGGKHSKKNDYPDVLVKPIGVLTAVVYDTAKEGDGQSFYIHQMGELTHQYPFLCIDSKGRLWLAGGSYSAPPAGITN